MLSTIKTHLSFTLLIFISTEIYAEEVTPSKPVKFSNVNVSAEYDSNIDMNTYLYLPYINRPCQITFKNYNVKNRDTYSGIAIGQNPQRYSTLYKLNIDRKDASISDVSGGCQLDQTNTDHYSLSFINNNACEFTITTLDFYTSLTYFFHVAGKGKEQLIINVSHNC